MHKNIVVEFVQSESVFSH